ncbi:hypothetical protein [Actinoplanes philippinensis]
MFARKLSRLAGLVFVLAVVIGGVGVGAATTYDTSAVVLNTTQFEWL